MATLPTFTPAQVVQQLSTNFGGSLQGKTLGWNISNITYAINRGGYDSPGRESQGFVTMTAAMVAVAQYSFEIWDDLIAISLNEVTSGTPSITFNYSSATSGGGTYSYPVSLVAAPPNTAFNVNYQASAIWMGSRWATHDDDSDMVFGSYGVATYMHEVGHSLMMSHSGQYNGTANYATDAKYQQDNAADTIMSYFRPEQAGYDHGGLSAQTPMLYDVLTIQSFYGADMTTRTGNTTYGFNANAGNNVFDFTINKKPILTIWDAGGIDTLDLSGFTTNQIISLVAGTYSDVAGFTHNLAIAFGASIENLVGGSAVDQITGNALDNKIEGKAGNDIIDGGGGTDTAIYGAARSQFTINTVAGVTTVVHNGGNLGTDTLRNVEKLQFTDQTVSLTAAAQIVISTSDVSIAEGNSGTSILTFTVSLNNASTTTVTANFAINSGTAKSPSDYVAQTGTVTFTAGQTSQTINVVVNGDTVREVDETVNLVLSNATNATFSSRGATLTAIGTIRNDDVTTVGDDFPASTATSGRIGAGDTVQGSLETTTDSDWFATDLVAGRTYSASVPAFVNSGGALATLDFRNATGISQVSSTNGTLQFTPTTTGRYYLDVSSPTGTTAPLQGYNLTLTDTGRATSKYTLSVANVSIAEDGGSATITVLANSVITGNSVSFDIATSNGTALAGTDYTAVSRTVTFGNSDRIEITIPVTDDTAAEGNETFTVNITNIQGAVAAAGGNSISATVTIIDNDATGDDFGNTTATAGVAGLGSTNGNLEVNADSDWLRVDVEAGNIYTFNARGAASNGGSLSDPTLILRDANGNQIDLDDDSGSGLDASITFTALQNQTFYVDIQSYQNSLNGTYTLDVSRTAIGETSVEGGNTLATATPIPADFAVYQTLNFPASDQNDYYGIAVSVPIDFYLNLSGLTADLDIFLFDANGNELDRSENVGTLEEEIKFHISTAGNYFIQVKGFSSSISPYLLQGAAIIDTTRALVKSDTAITLNADKAAAFLTGNANASITGSGNNDWLVGNLGENVLRGNAGDDFIGGGAGNDNLSGGIGDDYLVGGLGDDVFSAELGNDSYLGEAGSDLVDFSASTVGITLDFSTTAAQQVSTDFGMDSFSGIEGLAASKFNDNITGSNTDEVFNLSDGDDTINAGGGDDLINGGKGNDNINGGAGNDSALYLDATSGVTVSLARTGAQAVGGGLGSDTLTSIENLAGSEFADSLTGNSGANIILGNLGDDRLNGGQGSDVLAGGDGDDRLDGGSTNAAEIDVLYGGVGNDTYIVLSQSGALDIVFEGGTLPGGAADIDTIISNGAFYWDFYDVGEILTISAAAGGGTQFVSGKGNSTLNGNDLGNILLAYGGSNVINPGKGVDTIGFGLYGLASSFNGANTARLKAGDDINYIYDFQSGIDKIDTSAYGRFADGAQMLANVADTSWGSFVWMGVHEGQNEYVGFVGLNKADLDAGDFLV